MYNRSYDGYTIDDVMRSLESGNSNVSTIPCRSGWTYDRSVYEQTIVTDVSLYSGIAASFPIPLFRMISLYVHKADPQTRFFCFFSSTGSFIIDCFLTISRISIPRAANQTQYHWVTSRTVS